MTGSTVYRIELDSVRRQRSTREHRYVPRARCNGHEVVGDGFIVRDLCRILAGQNSQIDAVVEVFRGDTPAFKPMPIKTWLKDNPFAGEQPEHFRK